MSLSEYFKLLLYYLMKKALSLFASAATIVLCISCTETVTNPYGGIVGSVSDKTTGEPVPTVRLTLNPGGASTVTGTDGSFSFQNLNHGEYTVTLAKDGYNTGTDNITVSPGQQVQAHLLIERIPASITADCEMLDFGETASVNSLSFKIVNSDYETLSWTVTHNCPWITETEPASGILESGKTETIVVSINRALLEAGENETVIIVRSDGSGSTEIKVTASRYEENRLPAVNFIGTQEEIDWTEGTGTFICELTDAGYPPYTEKGIIIHTYDGYSRLNSTKLASTDPEHITGLYTISVIGLSSAYQYRVQAYATNSLGTAESKRYLIPKPQYIEIPAIGIAVMTEDTSSGPYSTVKSLCENSIVGGYTDWRLPDIDELVTIYTMKDAIGNFKDASGDVYWSSSKDPEEPDTEYLTVFFYNGAIISTDHNSYGRCVRDLTE